MRTTIRTAVVLTFGVATVLAGSGAAQAAGPARTIGTFTAQTSGSGIALRFNLSGVPGASSLPNLPGLNLDATTPQTLELINAAGVAARHTSTAQSTATGSTLAGTLAAMLSQLSQQATSTLASPGPHSASAASFPATHGIGPGAFEPVTAATDTATLGNDSSAELATLRALSVQDILGASLPANVTSALSAASGQLQAALTTLQSTLTTVLGSAPLPANVKALDAELTALESTLKSLPSTLLSEPLITLSGVSASQHITHTASEVTGSARAALADLSLLGGLVELHGFNNSVAAAAGGRPGSATATVQPNVATASVSNLADVSLGPNGLSADLGALDAVIPASVVSALNTALSTAVSSLNSVLSSVGIKIIPAEYSKSAAANGTSASASSSGLAISVTPPGLTSSGAAANAADALLLVRVGAADASVTAALAAPVVTVAAPVSKTKALAYTGADLPLTGGVALGLLTIGLLLRRRRRTA